METRSNTNNINVDKDKRTVEGLAVVFNKDSEDMGFIEQISRDAITEDTIKQSDIFAYLDHDPNRGVLARSKQGKGSLKLWLTDEGLNYRFKAPKTALGDELLEYLDRGDITGSSFSFTVSVDGDTWSRSENGLKRTINKIDRLFDVSPVFVPAYEATTVIKRSLEKNEILKKLDQLSVEIETL